MTCSLTHIHTNGILSEGIKEKGDRKKMKAEVRAIYIISALESDVNGLELHKYLTRLDIAGLCNFLFVCLETISL